MDKIKTDNSKVIANLLEENKKLKEEIDNLKKEKEEKKDRLATLEKLNIKECDHIIKISELEEQLEAYKKLREFWFNKVQNIQGIILKNDEGN